jgi:tetratricopeptide (TPR) repeat protein
MEYKAITKVKAFVLYINASLFFIVILFSTDVLSQTSSDDYNDLGLNELEHLNDKKAIKYFDKAIELDSPNETAYFNRAKTYCKLGEFKKSMSDYNRIILLSPYDNQLYFGVGQCYYGMKEYQKAIEMYTKSIELSSISASSYLERALSKLELGDQVGACDDLKKSISLHYDVEIKEKIATLCK